ncbi:MAG TPA: ABC transporter ATP-binding protein [Ilumatobacter sp.]
MKRSEPSSDVAIRCERVVKRFGDVVALNGLDLTVERGTVVGYLGPNGSGKSTTIRILLDLARADAGAVAVLGHEPRAAGPALRSRIGYLPGELRLDDRLSVRETLRSWAVLRGDGVVPAYVDELCDRLDLDPTRANRTLSSGNRRKVGLVGAFMARPELLVLDEPTSGVDPLVQAEFLALVDEARHDGRTVFLSSHVLSEVQRLADEVIVIRSGEVVATGSLDDLRQQALQPFVVWFDGDPPMAELHTLGGISGLERVHGGEVQGVIEGGPDDLLQVLARHRVVHVLFPEPDLEQAFLTFYGEPDGAATGGERS